MSGTIDCINGASKAVSRPAGLRSGESGGSGGEDDERDAGRHGQRGGEEPAALARLEARELHLGTGAVLDGDAAQPRLDDAIGDEPAQQDDEDARRAGEAPVAVRLLRRLRIAAQAHPLDLRVRRHRGPRGDAAPPRHGGDRRRRDHRGRRSSAPIERRLLAAPGRTRNDRQHRRARVPEGPRRTGRAPATARRSRVARARRGVRARAEARRRAAARDADEDSSTWRS